MVDAARARRRPARAGRDGVGGGGPARQRTPCAGSTTASPRAGPLGVLRDVPQLGLARLVAVLLAGTVGGAGRGATTRRRTAACRRPRVPPCSGPASATRCAAYVGARRERGDAARARGPTSCTWRWSASCSACSPRRRRRCWRAWRSSGPTCGCRRRPERGAVGRRRPTSSRTCARCTRRRPRARPRTGASSSALPRHRRGPAEQQRFRDFYERRPGSPAGRPTAYRTGCACVFAVVVRGPAAALAALPALSGCAPSSSPPGRHAGAAARAAARARSRRRPSRPALLRAGPAGRVSVRPRARVARAVDRPRRGLRAAPRGVRGRPGRPRGHGARRARRRGAARGRPGRGRLVGTGRLLAPGVVGEDATVGRLAVAGAARGPGVGRGGARPARGDGPRAGLAPRRAARADPRPRLLHARRLRAVRRRSTSRPGSSTRACARCL